MRLYTFSEPYCLFISQVFSFFEVAFFFRYHNICIVWLDVIGQKINLYHAWKIALFWLICSKKQIIGSLCFHPLQDRRRITNPRYCPYNLSWAFRTLHVQLSVSWGGGGGIEATKRLREEQGNLKLYVTKAASWAEYAVHEISIFKEYQVYFAVDGIGSAS